MKMFMEKNPASFFCFSPFQGCQNKTTKILTNQPWGIQGKTEITIL